MSGNCEKPEGIQASLFIFSNAETMKRCKSKVAKTAVVYVSYNHYRSFSLQAMKFLQVECLSSLFANCLQMQKAHFREPF